MVAFVKVEDFVDALGLGLHNLETGALTLALTNTAPASESPNPLLTGNGVALNLTQISYTNVTGGQPVLAGQTWTPSGGTSTLTATDEVITAVTGAIPTFRYIYMFNDTTITQVDQIIGHWDNGSTIDLALAESLTFTITTNLLTLA
jgi:hypothetical protein